MPNTTKFLYLDPAGEPVAAKAPEAELSNEAALNELIDAIRHSGQDPVTQLSGYLITEDPTYLPEGTNARAIARRVGRDKLLATLIELYLSGSTAADTERV